MAYPMRDDAISPVLTGALIALALAGSVFVQIKIPALGIGWSNVFVPVAGIALIVLHRKTLLPSLEKFRILFSLLAGLWLWTLIASIAGWDPLLSLRWLAKASGWMLVFIGATTASQDENHGRAILRTLWFFLAVLALGGVVEFLVPDHPLWRLFRTTHSLTIQPRIASVLSWPNQFGLIMAAGFFINEGLGGAGAVNRWAVGLTRVLLLTQLAQSGSRNAYLTFACVLIAGVATRMLPWKRGLVGAAVFATAVVLLPVASLQMGLGRVVLPQLEPQLAGRTWELSERKETLSLRSKLWRQAANEITANPISGVGPDVFQAQIGPRVMGRAGFNAHNLPLQIAVEIGVFGLILAVACVVALFYARTRHSMAILPLSALIVGQCLDCFIHDPPTMVVGAILCSALLSPGSEPKS